MADPFSLSASVFATIQIADRLIAVCKHYIEGVQDAPSDLRKILVETSTVKTILENVEFLLKCDKGPSSMFDGLSGPSGPIEGCRTAVAELLSLLPPNQNQGKKHGKSRRRRVQVALETLAWPLKETKARKLLEDIAQHKGTISFALTTDTAHCIRNIQKLLTESQQNEVYKSLNDVDPSSIHHRACGNHEPGTCDWMSRLPEWSKFLDGNIRCLWIHGIPGAGKTVLASQLIGNIEKHCMTLGSSDVRSISIYYYCYFGNNQDETASFLKWALVCLCRQAQQVPERLWEIFQHGGQPSIESLLSALEAALEKFHYVFITIDAIDESKPRDELLKVIRDLTTDHRFAKIRLLATSREYLDIEKGMEDISTEVSMRNPYLDADIRLYTHSRLNNHDKMKNWPPELRNETLEALCGGAKGMFRWVVCQIDALRRVKGTNAAIRKELRNLPKTLDDVYDRIFQTIPEEDVIVVHSAMWWICFHDKVSYGDIPCLTLLGAIENTISVNNVCRREYQYDIDLLREVCGCLITVRSEIYNEPYGPPVEEQYVSFAHYTVLEYLTSPRRYQPDRFFDLDRSELLVNQAEFLLKQAQLFNITDAHQFASRGTSYHTPVPNFPTYCALSALTLVSEHDSFLAERHDLASLVMSFNAEKGNFLDNLQKYAGDILQRYAGLNNEFADQIVIINSVDPSFSSVAWTTLPDPRIRTLVQLLMVGAFSLAHLLLQQSNSASILNTEIHLSVDMYLLGIDSDDELERWHFRGSLVDFFAMLCMSDAKAFKYLVESWAGTIDFRTVLVSYIAWHEHQGGCRNWCVVQRLLELGAQADSQDYVFTPLQVAVAFLDLEGVAILLRNGAAPSASGSPASEVFKNDKLGFSSILRGKSPLEICRSGLYKEIQTMECWIYSMLTTIYMNRFKDAENTILLIEKLLLEHGA